MGDLGGMFGGEGSGGNGGGGSTGGPVSSSAESGNYFGDFGADPAAGKDRMLVWVGIAAAAAMVLIVGIVALKR